MYLMYLSPLLLRIKTFQDSCIDSFDLRQSGTIPPSSQYYLLVSQSNLTS